MTSKRLRVEKPSERETFEHFETFKKVDDDYEQICQRKFNLASWWRDLTENQMIDSFN